MVIGLCVGEVRCLGAGEFDRKFICRQICKRTLKKIVEKTKKRERGKHIISRNSDTTPFLGKT